MKKAKDLLAASVQDESGQDLVEYALMLLVISLGAVAALHSLADIISSIPDALLEKFLTASNS